MSEENNQVDSNDVGNSFKVDDRVRRSSKVGPLGTVKALREEVIGSSGEADKKEVLIQVLWDNGTQSYFSPESIEVVE